MTESTSSNTAIWGVAASPPTEVTPKRETSPSAEMPETKTSPV